MGKEEKAGESQREISMRMHAISFVSWGNLHGLAGGHQACTLQILKKWFGNLLLHSQRLRNLHGLSL